MRGDVRQGKVRVRPLWLRSGAERKALARRCRKRIGMVGQGKGLPFVVWVRYGRIRNGVIGYGSTRKGTAWLLLN